MTNENHPSSLVETDSCGAGTVGEQAHVPPMHMFSAGYKLWQPH